MISYKCNIYHSKKTKYLEKMLRECCFVWNHALALQRRYYRLFGKYISVGVYADPAKEREKGVRAGAEAVRKSAWDAFRAQCPHIAFPYGKEFPMCDNHEQDHPMRDCILQCEKGRIFKNRLK